MKKIPLFNSECFALIDDADYDLISKFSWHLKKNKTNAYAGSNKRNKKGVWRTVKMHRIIMGLEQSDGKIVDHKDGNGLNNQRSNLRLCTPAQNCINRGKYKNKSSKYKGVCFYKSVKGNSVWVGWGARISVQNKTIFLGTFKNEEDAAKAYNLAAEKHYKEFAKLNIIK